jgi:hypothetical protein
MAGAIQVSRAHLARLSSSISHHKNRLAKVSQKAERAFDVAINTGIIVGAQSGLGFVHGRWGAVEVAGVPLELAGGLALSGAALFGFGGKHHDKVGTAGGALLGVYGYNQAKGAGMKMKAAAAAPKKPAPGVTGALPHDSLSREEVSTMDRPTDAQRTAA